MIALRVPGKRASDGGDCPIFAEGTRRLADFDLAG
jgi:hypothetical protein